MKIPTTGTDTSVPDDDDDDSASFTSQQTTAIDTPKIMTFASAPPRGTAALWMDQDTLDFEDFCLKSTASILTQLLARSISSMHCGCRMALFEHHLQHHRSLTYCEGLGFYAPSRTRSRHPRISLQVIDLAQGWSDTLTAPLTIADPSNCTLLQDKNTLRLHLNSWMPLQHSWRARRHSSASRRTGIHKQSFCSKLALQWQSLHLQSGLNFADAPCNNEDVHYTNKKEPQSRVQLVTSPIALQQIISTLPLSFTSKDSQVGLAAWFVSALLCCCFCKICGQ